MIRNPILTPKQGRPRPSAEAKLFVVDEQCCSRRMAAFVVRERALVETPHPFTAQLRS